MSYPFILQGDNITIVIDSTPHTINKNHITYDKIKEAIRNEQWDIVKDIVNPRKVIINYGKGNVSIQGETLFWKGEEFHNAMSGRMIDMLRDGFSIEPMVLFMENLMLNPSNRSVQELYGFLENNNLPITPDGCFLAYKRIKEDYTDCHTGTLNNAIGSIVEMERNKVNDNKDETCSTGLHFCSQEYLKSFPGDRTVILKINPRDVVSIPVDYKNSKGRTCRYEVIGEIENTTEPTVFNRSVQPGANSSTDRTTPKLGTTDFYRGYTDGFYFRQEKWDGVNKMVGASEKNKNDYVKGWDKGRKDGTTTGIERYQYVTAPSTNGGNHRWPFPA